MSEFISATHDVVFKALFVGNPELLKPFVSDVLEEPLGEKDRVLILNPLPLDSYYGASSLRWRLRSRRAIAVSLPVFRGSGRN